MSLLKTRTVTRVRTSPGGTDAYGDPIDSTSTETPIHGVLCAPRTDLVSMGEPTDRGRQGVVIGYTLYLPRGADVTRHDQFRLDGDTLWEVDGEPGPWDGHRVGGIEVALRRAEG